MATAAREPAGASGFQGEMHVAARTPQASPEPQSGNRILQPEQAAFDRWLHEKLSRLYDPVLNEPVPAALRMLLERSGKK